MHADGTGGHQHATREGAEEPAQRAQGARQRSFGSSVDAQRDEAGGMGGAVSGSVWAVRAVRSILSIAGTIVRSKTVGGR